MIEISKFDIEYLPRAATKGQVLVDFVAKFTNFPKEVPVAPHGKPWQVYIDGSSCWAGRGVGVHIVIKHEKEHNYTIKLAFKATNNRPSMKHFYLGCQWPNC